MALLAEQSGGLAMWGERATDRVLEVVPQTPHERCPLFCGSASDVRSLQAHLAAASALEVATPALP